jgi:COX assembly mitochondrial protein 1
MAEPMPVLKKSAENEVMRQVKEVAKKDCGEYIRALAECVQGRMVSVAWACRASNRDLRNCMKAVVNDEKTRDDVRRQ